MFAQTANSPTHTRPNQPGRVFCSKRPPFSRLNEVFRVPEHHETALYSSKCHQTAWDCVNIGNYLYLWDFLSLELNLSLLSKPIVARPPKRPPLVSKDRSSSCPPRRAFAKWQQWTPYIYTSKCIYANNFFSSHRCLENTQTYTELHILRWKRLGHHHKDKVRVAKCQLQCCTF